MVWISSDRVILAGRARRNAMLCCDNTFNAFISTAYRDDYLQRVLGQSNDDRSVRSLNVSNLTDGLNHQYLDSAGDRTPACCRTGRPCCMRMRFDV